MMERRLASERRLSSHRDSPASPLSLRKHHDEHDHHVVDIESKDPYRSSSPVHVHDLPDPSASNTGPADEHNPEAPPAPLVSRNLDKSPSKWKKRCPNLFWFTSLVLQLVFSGVFARLAGESRPDRAVYLVLRHHFVFWITSFPSALVPWAIAQYCLRACRTGMESRLDVIKRVGLLMHASMPFASLLQTMLLFLVLKGNCDAEQGAEQVKEGVEQVEAANRDSVTFKSWSGLITRTTTW